MDTAHRLDASERELRLVTPASLVERLKHATSVLSRDVAQGVSLLEGLYHPEVRFRSPLQSVAGRPAFLAMMRRMAEGQRRIVFQIESGTESGDALFLVWRLSLAPRHLGSSLEIEGVSRCRLSEGRIVEQRDYFDLLGSASDAIPLAGSVFKKLVARFAA
jgi:ketosteroid isomerase-like protein